VRVGARDLLTFSRVLAAAAYCLFLATSFRAGWNRAETDFPNYYTAAVLVRKGEPLRKFYDWTWFQRQMNYAGVEAQLGSYVPQTPVTMLPMVPLARFPVQTAKRAWLLLNLGFLAGTFWLLARVTQFSFAQVALVAFVGHGTLASNFLLGQYYVFLLFLLALAFFHLDRERPIAGGAVVGMAFVLKLYAGPLFLFFAARRRWKAFVAGIFGAVSLAALAVVLFGWSDTAYFASDVLPRALAGDSVDPYNAGYQTISAVLRRTFVLEPELNPYPVWNMPWIFFLLGPLVTLTLLALPLVCARADNFKRDFAWFLIAIVLASTTAVSYTLILLLLPVMLLLDSEGPMGRLLVLGCYAFAAMPLRPAWVPFFPKVWILLVLYYIAGRHELRLLPLKRVAVAAVAVTTASLFIAHRAMASYQQEPGRHWERILTEPRAIFSGSPAVLQSGIVYQSIGKKHYDLGYLHDGSVKRFAFDGEALLPEALAPDGPVRFELVSHRRSRTMLLDPASGRVSAWNGLSRTLATRITSPDGRWIVFTCLTQVCLEPAAGGETIHVTGGNCNSYTPAWEPDSSGIVFASDCGRGFGLPALYRASVANIKAAATKARMAAPARTKE
jgi:glycosyl transferase family 87